MRAAITVLGLLAIETAERPGEPLSAGDRLEYESGGRRSAWIIDSVATGDDPACGRVWLRRDGARESRWDCVRGSVLMRWNPAIATWVEQRPVAPATRRSYPRAAGGRVDFETGPPAADTIAGRIIPVVETTVTTFDSTGAAVRRLRERYSIGLTTATGGVFEIPDGAAPSGWRAQQEFRLVAVGR